MKKARRIFCLALCIVMCAGLLAACGSGGPQPADSAPAAPSAPASSAQPAPSSAPPPSPSSSNIFGEGGSVVIGGEETTEETKYREALTVVVDQSTISVIDPFSPGTVAGTKWAQKCYLSRLVNEINGEYIPMLAKEWKTDDWQHINFKLRDDVYFHNGEKFTADDVVYTVERAKNSQGALSFDFLNGIEKVEVVNDYEINITLVGVNVDFLYNLSQSHAGMVNRKACEADPEEGAWIGTGPWVVVEFVPNEYVSYIRNENYWGDLPQTKELTLKYVANIPARVMMLERDEIQFSLGLDPSDFPYLEESPQFDTYKYVDNNPSYIAFNMNDPICGDINFRKAIASLLIPDELALACRNGYAMPESGGTFWGYATEFRNTDIPRIPHNIEKAKEYIGLSSYNGEPVEIVVAFADKLIKSEWLQEQCKAIGVNIVIYQTDVAGMSAYATYANNQAQMVVHTGSWSNLAIASRSYLYPGAAGNRASYSNDEVTALLDLAPTVTDIVEREKIYKQIQAIVAEDIPYICVYYLQHVAACQPGVAGMTLRSDSFHDFSYVYMIEQ